MRARNTLPSGFEGPSSAPCGAAWPLLFLGLLAAAGGAIERDLVLVAFALPLLLGPMLLIVLLRRALARVEVRRGFRRAVFEGEELEVRIRLRNRSRWSLFSPRVLDAFPPELHARKSIAFPFRVRPGETVVERYRGRCLLPRGRYRLGPGWVEVSDPFGLFLLRRRIPGRRKLKVYPRIVELGPERRAGRALELSPLERTLGRRGQSLEYFCVREYRLGDPPRRIHWPLSARHGALVVREFERPSGGDLAIVLDLHRRALLGIGRGSSLEHAIRIAVACARRALRQGKGVELHSAGKRGPRRLRRGRGLRQLHALLDHSVRLRPDGATPLRVLLDEACRGLRPGDTVLYTVSPYLASDPELLAAAARLRRRGLRQVAALFDERSFKALRYGEVAPPGLSAALAPRLAACGAEVHLVACNADLRRALARRRT